MGAREAGERGRLELVRAEGGGFNAWAKGGGGNAAKTLGEEKSI